MGSGVSPAYKTYMKKSETFFLVYIKLSSWEINDCQQMCLIEHGLGLDVKSHLFGSCTKTDVKDFIGFFFFPTLQVRKRNYFYVVAFSNLYILT